MQCEPADNSTKYFDRRRHQNKTCSGHLLSLTASIRSEAMSDMNSIYIFYAKLLENPSAPEQTIIKNSFKFIICGLHYTYMEFELYFLNSTCYSHTDCNRVTTTGNPVCGRNVTSSSARHETYILPGGGAQTSRRSMRSLASTIRLACVWVVREMSAIRCDFSCSSLRCSARVWLRPVLTVSLCSRTDSRSALSFAHTSCA